MVNLHANTRFGILRDEGSLGTTPITNTNFVLLTKWLCYGDITLNLRLFGDLLSMLNISSLFLVIFLTKENIVAQIPLGGLFVKGLIGSIAK